MKDISNAANKLYNNYPESILSGLSGSKYGEKGKQNNTRKYFRLAKHN